MNKTELLAALRTGGINTKYSAMGNLRLSRAQMSNILEVVFDEIAKSIRKNRRFSYPGFGTFTIRVRKARMGVNPQTKRPLKIPASKTVGFKPAPLLKRGL